MAGLCTLIVTGAPLTARAAELCGALVGANWRVSVVATPSAVPWLDADAIAAAAGAPPQVEARDPRQPKRAARPGAVVVAPATFTTVNKLASGIADTLAHSVACEAIGAGVRVVVVPMVNDLLWGHPALARSLECLELAGVRMVDIHTGDTVPTPVASGTGPEVIAAFRLEWITAVVGRPADDS